MESVQRHVLRVIAGAIICAICQSVPISNKATGAAVRIVTGLMLAVTVLSPFVQLEIGDFSSYLVSIDVDTAAAVAEGEQIGQTEMACIITERSEAYILDKAESLDLNLQVQVKLTADPPLRPDSILLKGAVSPYAQSVLGTYITKTLGIPEEKQQWSKN